MRKSDITEALVNAIETKIGQEWRHEVCVDGFSNSHINFDIDEKEYVLVLYEVRPGEHWSDYVEGA